MSSIEIEAARAQLSERLSQAQRRRREHQLIRARRMARKAERAALQAKLALARAI